MSLRRLPLATLPAVRSGCALAVLGLLGTAILTASPEKMVTQNFAEALKAAPAPKTAATEQPVSGSEAFWLAEKRRHEADGAAVEPASWSIPMMEDVSVGDRITISTATAERVLEVVSISIVEPPRGATPRATGTDGRQIAVTCRDTAAPDAPLTTFLTQAAGNAAQAKAARAL